jgi:hypothetical protein
LSKKQFRKSVESLRYQIIRHHQKIADEQQKELPDENLIHYWRREIAELEKSLGRVINQGERILCEQNLKEIVIVPTST